MIKQVEAMSEAINNLGNALTAAKWPGETADRYQKLMEAYCDFGAMGSNYKDAVNELCYKCGWYTNEHHGACNGCRWKTAKEGF